LIDDSVEFDGKNLNIFATESATKSTKYPLQTKNDGTVSFYVNGTLIDDDLDDAVQTYLLDSNVGSFELVDTYKTDGYYDAIYVNYYATAEVDSVNTSTKKITLIDATTNTKSITLDTEAEDKLVYHIYYNGEEISLAELKSGDIISIAYDVTAAKDQKSALSDSLYYDIYVSRNTQSGKLSGINDSDEEVTIGGTTYSFVGDYATEVADLKGNLGSEYTLSIDYFGNIFSYELNSTVTKYAVLDRVVNDNGTYDDLRLTMFTADGEAKIYTADSSKLVVKETGKSDVSGRVACYNAIKSRLYADGDINGTKNHIARRVISYKVSSSTGYVIEVKFLDPESASTATVSESNPTVSDGSTSTYKERTNAIGSIKMNDATKVIDAITYVENGDTAKYTDLTIATSSSFVDDTDYEAYAYGDRVDGVYPLVLVTVGEGKYNEDTRFAVIADTASTGSDDSNDDIYTLKVLTVGSDDVQSLIAADDVTINGSTSKDPTDLLKGEVIVYSTNAKGYIDEIYTIFSLGQTVTYNAMLKAALVVTDQDAPASKLVSIPGNASSDWVTTWGDKSKSSDPIEVVFGPVMEKGKSYFTVGQFAEAEEADGLKVYNEDEKAYTTTYTGLYTDKTKDVKKYEGGVYTVNFSSDTNVYVWDFDKATKYALETGTTGDIAASTFAKSDTVAGEEDIIPWSYGANQEDVNFVFALVVDGEAVDVLVFNN
jgi:hypothetical protein